MSLKLVINPEAEADLSDKMHAPNVKSDKRRKRVISDILHFDFCILQFDLFEPQRAQRFLGVFGLTFLGVLGLIFAASLSLSAAEPLAQDWDYAPAMRDVAQRCNGKPGVVLHLGDSMTYANPYGQWARLGTGKTADDKAALEWMHTGAENDLDGWWLARVDLPGGRSHTAAGGLRLDELLAGGKAGLPPLSELLDQYRPQAIVIMLGTNDASAGRGPAPFQADLLTAVKTATDRGVVPVLSTIPPHSSKRDLGRRLNESIRGVARRQKLPLIDLEKEILTRRPDDWNGTLLNKDDVHLSATHGKQGEAGFVDCSAAPTDENLRQVGYLLRGWLSVRKLAELKRNVFDRAATAAAAAASEPAKSSARQDLRLDVTRDTWLSNVGKEADGNNGGADKLKVKSIQEMSLVDFEPQPLRGRLVRSASLHLRPSGPEILHRVTIGTVSADWTEGTASGYQTQPGSACFNWRHFPGEPWAYPGSNFCEVILGRGGSRWGTADASPPGEGGWQTVAIDPRVVAARVAGCSFGLFVFDDTGSEWDRDGDQFKLHHFPNRFLYSRDSGRRNAPYLTIELGEPDGQPPQAPAELVVETTERLPPGEARLSWLTPKDEGPGETIGFHATLNGETLPSYLLPVAGLPGQRVTMHLRDVAFNDNSELAVWAVDSAGNEGPAARVRLSKAGSIANLLPPKPEPPKAVAQTLPKFAGATVAIIDPLDKVAPAAGKLIPEQSPGYLRANHLWNANDREIHLYAAKNEFVGFQLWLNGNVPNLMLTTEFAGPGPPAQVEWFRLYPVPAGEAAICDAALPLEGLEANGSTRVFVDQQPPEWPSGLPQDSFLGENGGALLCELYVPHQTQAGEYAGKLVISQKNSQAEELHIKLRLTVWDFTLPDYLSFLPEMNCYGLPANERDSYRLAHRHRTFLNRVPYHQNGSVADGCAPEWDGRQLNWNAWDKRFGPYLDGSAFADLPRGGVPIEGFYLPWHENWPSPMEGNYNGDYWADRAFPASYRQALVEVARQMATHFAQRGWHDTLFQGFLNNKNNFKEHGWFRGSSPWLLDEPANFQDYWALAWFGQAFHEGVDRARGKAKLLYRCDISRPEWQRDLFDDVLDYNVVGGAMRRYRRMVLDRKQAHGQVVVEYGSANAIDKSNVQPAAWCLDAWALGVDGVLPWQTVGTDASWKKADTLALFYPGRPAGYQEPVASLRLKAFCRGQQDVEYLTLFSHLKRAPRWQLGQEVRKWLGLSGERRASGVPAAEDAGVIHYGAIQPRDLWELRTAVGKALSAAHPDVQRQLVKWDVPTRPMRPLNQRLAE